MNLFLLELFDLSRFLFDRFFEAVATNSRNFSVLLIHFDSVQIRVLDQFEVDLVFLAHLFNLFKVPWALLAMCVCGGYSFGNFKLVVHIKAPFGDHFVVADTFFLRSPFALFDFKLRVSLGPRSVVLTDVPRDVSVIIVLVHR
jgi:hypothetical protein